MISKRLITTALIFIFLGTTPLAGGVPLSAAADPGASAGEGGMPAPQMKIAIHDGLLSLDVRDVEIGDILRVVAEKTGIGLTVGEGVGGKVTLLLEDVSLEEALRRLCASRAILYEYDPETRIGRIIGVGAFASGSGPSAGLRPGAAVPVPAAAQAAGKALKRDGALAAGEIQPPQGGLLPGAEQEERRYDSQGRLLFKPRELLVRFRPEATAAQMTAIHQSLGSTVLKSLDYLKLHRVLLREGLSEKDAVVLYSASETVAVAERHALRYPLLSPDDPQYNSQWGLPKIGMPAVWDITKGNANVVVGVIDTGVDIRHPDLAANIWTNPAEIPDNGIDDDGNGYIDDVHGWDLAGTSQSIQNDGDNNPTDRNGHGTHVAGIIAAVGNNGVGVAGVGWDLRIMPLKVLADGSFEIMETFDIIAAIDYAIAERVRVVNCSFGGEAPDPLVPEEVTDFQNEYDAFDRLRQAGILAVCAAGNDGVDNNTSEKRIYPASHDLDNIISVAASNSSDGLWVSSPYGSNYGKASVDLMAPGDAIRSTCLCSPAGACGTTSGYCEKSGTSMAAPHVSGVAGLILSRKPELGYAQVKSILLENVDKIAAVSDKLVSGGRLNAAKALSQVCYPGEVTGKSGIGLADAILALRIASGMEAGVPVCRMADVNGDGRIGLAEAIYGLQVLSGLRG